MKFDSHDCPIRKLRIILSFFAKKSQLGYEKYWIHEAFFWCHDQMKIGISKWSGISYFFFSKEFKRTLGGRKRDRSRGRFVISFRFSVTHVFHECYRRDRYANSRSHRKERIDSTAFFYLVVQNGVRFVRGRKPLADDSISAPRSSPPPPAQKEKENEKKGQPKSSRKDGLRESVVVVRAVFRTPWWEANRFSERSVFFFPSFFLSFFLFFSCSPSKKQRHLDTRSAKKKPGSNEEDPFAARRRKKKKYINTETG